MGIKFYPGLYIHLSCIWFPFKKVCQSYIHKARDHKSLILNFNTFSVQEFCPWIAERNKFLTFPFNKLCSLSNLI
jgi:hypothetical protein